MTIAGSLQYELGCPGDWQPECAATQLGFDADDGVWQATLPAPGRQLGVQGRARTARGTRTTAPARCRDGPEHPARRSARRPRSSSSTTTRPTGSPTTSRLGHRHGAGQLPERARLRRPTGTRAACGRGCRTPTATASAAFSTSTLPPGDYEAKVAIDEAWDENYGAGGVPRRRQHPVHGGQRRRRRHVQLRPVAATSLDDRRDPGGAGRRRRARARARCATRSSTRSSTSRIPDRFNDGDTGATTAATTPARCVADDTQENVLTHGYLPSDKGYYHGGDIEGLRRKLPYLDDLGITAIWVGPIFANKPVQSDTTNLYGHSSGYHGYWIQDFLQRRPAPRHQRRVRAAGRRGPRPRHQGVHGHRHQPHRRRHPARGQRRLPQQARLPVPRRRTAQPFDDSRLRLRRASPTTRSPRSTPTSFPYTPVRAARRGGRQEPGVAQRPAAVPQPGQHQLHAARTRSTATSSASTTCGPSAARWSRGWSTSTRSGSRSSASTGSASTPPST